MAVFMIAILNICLGGIMVTNKIEEAQKRSPQHVFMCFWLCSYGAMPSTRWDDLFFQLGWANTQKNRKLLTKTLDYLLSIKAITDVGDHKFQVTNEGKDRFGVPKTNGPLSGISYMPTYEERASS